MSQVDLDEIRYDFDLSGYDPDGSYIIDSGWYVEGAGDEWWAPTMPPRAFMQEGLVHLSASFDGTRSYCGVPATPYGVQLFSTDAAKAYARDQADFTTEVTCFLCISYEAIIAADRGTW